MTLPMNFLQGWKVSKKLGFLGWKITDLTKKHRRNVCKWMLQMALTHNLYRRVRFSHNALWQGSADRDKNSKDHKRHVALDNLLSGNECETGNAAVLGDCAAQKAGDRTYLLIFMSDFFYSSAY